MHRSRAYRALLLGLLFVLPGAARAADDLAVSHGPTGASPVVSGRHGKLPRKVYGSRLHRPYYLSMPPPAGYARC